MEKKNNLNALSSQTITTKIKICGLMRESDIIAVNRSHPDFAGFVFAKSKRQITLAQAAAFRSLLDHSIPAIGVFVNEDPEKILDICNAGIIQWIQLHGQESEETIQYLKARLKQSKQSCPIIKAVSVQTAQDIRLAETLSCDYLLLDHGSGGTGQSFDWSSIPHISKPFFLAGGLNQTNIKTARHYHAYCLDVSSGAETNGKKDAEKIHSLVEAVHGCISDTVM